METLFWAAALTVLYVYAGYPLLLAAWVRMAPRPVRRKAVESARRWPSISIIIAARNEAARLKPRIANLVDVRYPGSREIIVVSDGSSDETPSILGELQQVHDVRTIVLPPGGKPRAVNAGAAAATGDILLFADARQTFDREALVELVANFDDPAIGGVTGELILDCEDGGSDSPVGDGVGLYWRYEKWLRRQESLIWSTLGATGAIYALRRELWQPLPPETLLDDVLAPMRAVLGGRRVVFEDRARAYDRTAPDSATESRRKTRTLAGNYQVLALEPRLLLPGVNPVWLQYMSHKIGRLIVPWALLVAFFASATLAPTSWLYTSAFVLQLGFYAMAAVGGWLDARQHRREAFAAERLNAVTALREETR